MNVHTTFILMFLSFHGLVGLSIAQLVEHCSANAEAMDSNPVEAFSLNLQSLKTDCYDSCDGHIFI